MVTLQLRQLAIPPGHRVLFKDVMRGKRRIDLSIDPPPDLAIEVDVTSKTQLDAYLSFQVPELWCYENNRLQISILQGRQYLEVENSPTFPNLPVVDLISELVRQSAEVGRSPALREFRKQVRALIDRGLLS